MHTAKRTLFLRLGILIGLLSLIPLSFRSVRSHPNGWLTAFLYSTHRHIEKPKAFGTYHLFMLGICFLLAAATVFFFERRRVVCLDRIVFLFGIGFFFLEWYKQLYHYAVLDGQTRNFGILPLQFCSYCLYFALLIPFLPEGKLKDTLYQFCAFYQTMGGALVMAYPLFYRYASLSVHTMLWHTAMICMGLLIMIARDYGRRYFAEVIPPIAVFAIVFAVSVVLNVVLKPYAERSPQPLNLFYMSPYEPCRYWIIKDVRDLFGYPASLLAYAFLFVSVGANLCWGIAKGMFWMRRKKN